VFRLTIKWLFENGVQSYWNWSETFCKRNVLENIFQAGNWNEAKKIKKECSYWDLMKRWNKEAYWRKPVLSVQKKASIKCKQTGTVHTFNKTKETQKIKKNMFAAMAAAVAQMGLHLPHRLKCGVCVHTG